MSKVVFQILRLVMVAIAATGVINASRLPGYLMVVEHLCSLNPLLYGLQIASKVKDWALDWLATVLLWALFVIYNPSFDDLDG